jgi:hypothetical protein
MKKWRNAPTLIAPYGLQHLSFVGWVEQSETHHAGALKLMGFRNSSTHSYGLAATHGSMSKCEGEIQICSSNKKIN